MRYSPTGTHIVMERTDNPRRIEVCDAATGAAVVTFPAGINPRWLDEAVVYAESPDGVDRVVADRDFLIHYIPANRGQLDANGHGQWAVSEPIGTTYLHDDLPQPIILQNAREPRLSAAGQVVTREQDTGNLRLWGVTELGPAQDARWSSETLVWWLGGRVWGRSTPDAPTVELTVPGRACAHPVPLWTGSQLYVGLVLDEGELWLATWSDLVARNGLGWRVGVSGGSNFDWALSA